MMLAKLESGMDANATNNGSNRYAKLLSGPWWAQFCYGSNPWIARYVYTVMFLLANLLAWAVRDYGPSALTEMSRFQAQLAQSQKQVLMGGVSGNVGIGVSSPSIVTPGNAKRSGQKQSSRPTGSSSGAAGSQLKSMELAPAAHRRKRAQPENQIPEKVAAF